MSELDTRAAIVDRLTQTSVGPPLGYLDVHIENEARAYDEWRTDGSDASETTSVQDPAGISFARVLDSYFSLRGVSQKKFRAKVVSSLHGSRRPEKRVEQVLEAIQDRASQDRLQAAIDLLSGAGPYIETVAMRLASSPEKQNADVAFVAAAAAGRANSGMIAAILAGALSEAMREAAVELATSLPATTARSLLRSVARHDRAPYIRNLAKSLLSEVK